MAIHNSVLPSKGTVARLALGVAGVAAATVINRLITGVREFPLAGKNALVTGGSRGLGLLIAHNLLQRGCNVAICARSEDELRRAAADLRNSGGRLVAISADIRTKEGCDKVVEAARSDLGGIDVLVNNAGIIVSGPFETMNRADYEELLQLYFWAPYHLSMALLPGMIERRSGRVVNISSIGGKIALPHLLPYTVAKFALQGFSKGLRAELEKHGVFVTTVCPGLMRTGSQLNAYFKGDYPAEYGLFKTISAIPGISIAAEKAARQVVHALERGQDEVVLGLSAKIADTINGIAPNVVSTLLAATDRLLPYALSKERQAGREIPVSRSANLLGKVIDWAAERYNQV